LAFPKLICQTLKRYYSSVFIMGLAMAMIFMLVKCFHFAKNVLNKRIVCHKFHCEKTIPWGIHDGGVVQHNFPIKIFFWLRDKSTFVFSENNFLEERSCKSSSTHWFQEKAFYLWNIAQPFFNGWMHITT